MTCLRSCDWEQPYSARLQAHGFISKLALQLLLGSRGLCVVKNLIPFLYLAEVVMVTRRKWVELVRKRKSIVLGVLAALSFTMMGVGFYYEHYFIVFAFCVWLCAEALLLKLHTLLLKPIRSKKLIPEFLKVESEEDQLWTLYTQASENSYTLLGLKISEQINGGVSELKKTRAQQFRHLSTLKLLVDCQTPLRGKLRTQQWILYKRDSIPDGELILKGNDDSKLASSLSTQDICEASVTVSDLLVRTLKMAESSGGRMETEARVLIEKVLGVPYDSLKARRFIDRLTDVIQISSGVPFLLLNLLRVKQISRAREIGKALLSNVLEVDEELKSTLYWVAEIEWFSTVKKEEVLDHDSAIRYLYHLCFTGPDRAGVLEIDSQFGSELGPVNEIVEEGFLFKESLVEAFLDTWGVYEGWFDSIFQNCLEAMTGRKSKIYDERANWLRYWLQEKEQFSREYLYVVEGNLCFASGRLEDAKFCYEKALEIAPELRSALFNLLYVCAKLKDTRTHEEAKHQILNQGDWMPGALASVGNSYFLLGDEKMAFAVYDSLRKEEGWERKVDFYISLFSFEHQAYDRALKFAIKAHELNPSDSSMSFHLSRCYSTVGQKDAALEIFKRAQGAHSQEAYGSQSAWMTYYRFTLERDSGREEEAVKTLLTIPRDYFQDSEELSAAVEFAKDRKDLVLLRHLKQ